MWVAGGGVAVAALIAGVVGRVTRDGDAGHPSTTPSTEGCTDLPYQPCGQAARLPAPTVAACLVGFEDYDEDADNGCEAAADEPRRRRRVP